MTLQEILNATEYPIETVYEGTPIQITYDPEMEYHDIVILDGPAHGVSLTGPNLEHLLINIPTFAKLFNHGPKTYGPRIEQLEKEVAQLKQEKDTDRSFGILDTIFEWSPDGERFWARYCTENDLYVRALITDTRKGQYYTEPVRFRKL